MNIYIDTCVLPRSHMETGKIYRDRFGAGLGFELLMMFDLPDFEANLRANSSLFSGGPLVFHEPVWGVEHSAPKGSREYDDGMYHILKTQEWANILRPTFMVCHLNNCVVPTEERDRMLNTSLENLEEIRDMFPHQQILVENTGTLWDRTALLTQVEFTDLCRQRRFPVLIDVGHANANGWDIPKLIHDLKDQIRGFHLHNNNGIHDLHNRLRDGTLNFAALIPEILSSVPDVPMVIEYTRPVFHGAPLIEDTEYLKELSLLPPRPSAAQEGTAENAVLPFRFDPHKVACIFQNMEDAVCVTGSSGKLLFTNASADQLLGTGGRKNIKIWDLIPYVQKNGALIQLFIDAVSEKKRTVRSLVDYVNNDGEEYRLLVSITCASEQESNLLIVISDLTMLIRTQTAFARYTSPEIADYVLNSPEGEKRGGQSRNVTILMSDLRGFTAISTRISSDSLIQMLNNYFEQMSAVVRRFHGTVIEFLGDSLFVVFGAPNDLTDHPGMAVRCAVEMQCAMEGVNHWNREHGFPALEMGIGIHTGQVVVGNIGSENKMKYGCIGETVNLTGRIESLTVGGQVMISEHTKQLIGYDLTVAGEQVFSPKGGRSSMKVFDITGIGLSSLPPAASEPEEWISPACNMEVTFFLLSGKAVDPLPLPGRLTRISTDEKCGILDTESELEPMTNLLLHAGPHDIYAKVMKKKESGYLLHFTMKPEKFVSLLK